MEFRVDPEGLKDGAVTFGQAARELERVDVGAAFESLAAAFRGGTTAAQVPDLARAWHERLLETRLRLTRSAEGLGIAGESYELVEQQASPRTSAETEHP